MIDTGYPSSADEVVLIDGAAEALRRLMANEYRLFIVSNQSGVGRGYFTETQMWSVHNRLIELFQTEGVTFTDSAYCTDEPSQPGSRRKPSPDMILGLINQYALSPSQCYMVGDKSSDVAAGCAAGCRSVFYGDASQTRTWLPTAAPCLSTNNWRRIADEILSRPPQPADARFRSGSARV
ncbi:D-glycero-alpha-D-manno-heptose-1,7-bisphosphate 7-phosphatase [Allorhodopirellula solitaria]|uniref:D,D-heptose 1,7-bisphosphate phosphatase n=2 Tax=Allorhodopirellula solitaria TaxID=2527987 RepID=A0A5C5WQ26_9BACT|nr:D-glycero-alpha-D-manno-heptose-1,7-bisphosphate 7-phosphatase [Allorhodopirellula solitaria]